MTASIPQQLHGTQAPSQVEVLWEKNRRTITLIAVALLVALGLNYLVRYFAQAKINKTWSAFVKVTRLDEGYINNEALKNSVPTLAEQQLPTDLVKELPKADPNQLDKAVSEAGTDEKAFLLWASACQAVLKGDKERANKLLDQLEAQFPNSSFCQSSKYPVQYREPTDKDKPKPDTRKKQAELQPPAQKKMTEQLRDQLTNASGFQEPANFKKLAIPEDAPKYRVETSMGDFTIAVFDKLAPKTAAEFQKLVDENFWKDMHVDQIKRTPSKLSFFLHYANEFHFGYLGSKKDERGDWQDKDPSKHQVEYEHTDLSHFPGAVAATFEGNKSSVDRLWISVEDNVSVDGTQVVFGYVVDGMDVLRKIGEDPFLTQTEEESGTGKPQDLITIKSVKKL
jgi:cyclophilin family peptidyl-prolyl cis-trans isomerase